MSLVRTRGVALACLIVLSTLVGASAAQAHAPTLGAVPQTVESTQPPGGSLTVNKVVHTPTIPPNPDIVLLVDTTTSMGPVIANVQSNLANLMNQVLAAQPTAQFAVTDYKDTDDPIPPFRVLQGLTGDVAAVQAGVNQLTPLSGGGSDAAEDGLNGLFQVATGAINFRPDGTRIVVWIGDSSSHDPSGGHSLSQVIGALQAAQIRVVALDVGPTPDEISDGLNSEGQASAVAHATGGTVLSTTDPSQVSSQILAGLQNLPVTVTHTVGPCDPNLTVGLSPASHALTSGHDATFSESIAVSAGAPQGTTITCQVHFLLNGQPGGPSFVETINVTVTDVTPPVLSVPSLTVEATSPKGAVINYTAIATDNVDGAISPTCTPPPGSTFPIAETTPGVSSVTCTATDAAGNTASATGTMTVVDTTPPDLDLPAPIVVEATGPDGAVVSYTATATDIVDVTAPVTCVPASGSTFPVGVGSTTTTVNCTSTDKHANTGTGSFTVTVQDTTPPQPACPATTNPSGTNVPAAGSNPRSGQNPDGFYELRATDVVDPNPQVFLVDTGSGTVFGPFTSGTRIKYTEANGATPGQKKMGNGAVQWHINGTGDAAVLGVDASGNRSPAVACLVPAPPK